MDSCVLYCIEARNLMIDMSSYDMYTRTSILDMTDTFNASLAVIVTMAK